jgi:asparagine synthase (glutamine-hydrolysing)
MVKMLDGMFAFVLHDAKNQRYLIARDHVGIVPLYYGWGADGSLCVASEMKALAARCVRFNKFTPGHYMSSAAENELVPYYTPVWLDETHLPSTQVCTKY